MMASYRLGVDVGATNTDLVLYDKVSGSQLVEKLPSTLINPATAILEAIDRFVARGVSPRNIEFFGHGTTVTTNALLESGGSLQCSGPGSAIAISLVATDGPHIYRSVLDRKRVWLAFERNGNRVLYCAVMRDCGLDIGAAPQATRRLHG
jgi:N-methylhydantoinase A/oxoprolinase/acetone carboxylase beta subunit